VAITALARGSRRRVARALIVAVADPARVIVPKRHFRRPRRGHNDRRHDTAAAAVHQEDAP
jgi:hypothetical protein